MKKIKSPISYSEEKIQRAKNILDDFKEFTHGYRVIFLILRNKEGGETNNTKVKKYIVNGKDEYFEKLKELVSMQMDSELPLRIYASLNERNFDKAIRQFKFEQLEADYYDEYQKERFYWDIQNRFVGALMQPAQRKESMFLFDIDNVENEDVLGESLKVLPSELIIKQYPTKNGWHIITQPFDYTKIKLPVNCEFKKDGLLLISY